MKLIGPISSLVFIFITIFSNSALANKEVVVIGTLHGDHRRFPLYNFETLRIVLQHLKPDLLLIEEDPESFKKRNWDKMSEAEYGANRPVEIKLVIMPYAEKEKIKVVPTDKRDEYDSNQSNEKDSLKALMANNKDKLLMTAAIESYESVFLDDYLYKSVYDFHKDSVMAILDQKHALAMAEPKLAPFEAVSDRRQKAIDKNVIEALANNEFKKAVVIYGLSHRPALVRAIKGAKVADVISLENALKQKVPGFFDREPGFTLPK
jgi:hypothetical protein